jgi:hypothetical protein
MAPHHTGWEDIAVAEFAMNNSHQEFAMNYSHQEFAVNNSHQ